MNAHNEKIGEMLDSCGAGHGGKSLAKVADEARALAQQSSDAAEKVALLIEECTQKAEESAKLVNYTDKVLKMILMQMKELTLAAKETPVSARKIGRG